MKLQTFFFGSIFLTSNINHLNAQGIEEWDSISPDIFSYSNSQVDNVIYEVPDISNSLFVGTSSNINQPDATLNDVYVTNTNSMSLSILSSQGVWGATSDPINQRVLYTQASGLTPASDSIGGGDNLFELPYSGGEPTLLGQITLAGIGLRVDGLAIRNGVLYGYSAGNGITNGFYKIDFDTLEATVIINSQNSISGIDADPKTCIIYGLNDTTAQVVQILPNGILRNLAPYPLGITDIDGLAVGEGYAYLVTDENQGISVLNLKSLQYEMTLISPFTNEDTFSGAALAVTDPSTDTNNLFANGFEFDYCAD